MRKSAEFTMENDKGTLSVRLQELTVREVLDMCEQFGKGPLVHDLERLLPRMSNLTTNDLMDMTPGELEMLWEQVKEVNAAFFRIAGALGFGRVLEAFRAQLRSDLMEAALNRELLRTVMRLAGAGHRDVFEYGWSAFVEALEAEAQRRDERMKDAALALRVALHTDGRQFKAFLEA